MESIDGPILILHDIRSAQNVGALFRTSDAAGIKALYLSAITPAPIDRFGRERNDIKKAALGAEKALLWKAYESITDLIVELKNNGYTVIAIEQSETSVDYKKVEAPEKTAFILGNEVEGVPKEVLSLCDIVAEIPMKGMKESLNVSVAAGVALFRMLDC